MRVDAHHHLWHYVPAQYGWIDNIMKSLRRDFLLADLRETTASANVYATVVVQAQQTLEETDWLLKLASEASLVRGMGADCVCRFLANT